LNSKVCINFIFVCLLECSEEESLVWLRPGSAVLSL
jgi:hypothetical protein